MRTARWQLVDSAIWIWLDDTNIEDAPDRYPLLRQWIEGMINGHLYILEDRLDEPWVRSHASTYPGPIATTKNRRYALMGSEGAELLRSHQEASGLSWVGGLRIYVFSSYEDVKAQLSAWDGQELTSLSTFIRHPLMTLTTGGDAQGLHAMPGTLCLPDLMELSRQVAFQLDFSWGPLQVV